MNCDILIAGGSAGGVAAALAAASLGESVILLEETDWLGGQLTTQGVCTPDEQKHIETFGGTRRYYAFRNATRDYYRRNYTLTPQASANSHLNVGNCWVSRVSYEPKVGAAILREMARPLIESGHLQIFYCTRVVALEMDSANPNRIAAVIARQEASEPRHSFPQRFGNPDGEIADGSPFGKEIRFSPHYVLDATDLGDLLPLCGSEGEDWRVGAEAQSETGEPDAPLVPHPEWVQPFTFPFALDWSPETAATNVIAPPPDYAELKAQQKYEKVLHGAITGLFTGAAPWWAYRRVLAHSNFDDSRVPADLAMINTGGNDYYGGNIIGANAGTAEDIAATLDRARRASLGYVYWLQAECPREDGSGIGYPEFRLRKDVFDTPDGCAVLPYIREARRIRAHRPILEQEIVVKSFKGEVCRGENARAAFMPDSVGVGHYALDIHQNGHGEPNAYVATRPFQIPLGALVPVRLENLLPACKNLGVTHLTNGAYRLHPIEWNIGESAGLLAAFCLACTRLSSETYFQPREIYASHEMRKRFQALLLREGIPLYWLIDVPLDHPAFFAVQTLAMAGAPVSSEEDLLFRPEESITPETWQVWREAMPTKASNAPESFTGTRAEAAFALAADF